MADEYSGLKWPGNKLKSSPSSQAKLQGVMGFGVLGPQKLSLDYTSSKCSHPSLPCYFPPMYFVEADSLSDYVLKLGALILFIYFLHRVSSSLSSSPSFLMSFLPWFSLHSGLFLFHVPDQFSRKVAQEHFLGRYTCISLKELY